MPLKITVSEEEELIRSVGDPPNGILGVRETYESDVLHLAVFPKGEPGDHGRIVTISSDEEGDELAVIVDTDDVIAGADVKAAGAIMGMVIDATMRRLPAMVEHLDFERATRYFERLTELRDGFEERWGDE